MAALQNQDLAAIAINVAGSRKLSAAVPIVETYLSDEDQELQITAATALQMMHSKKADKARK